MGFDKTAKQQTYYHLLVIYSKMHCNILHKPTLYKVVKTRALKSVVVVKYDIHMQMKPKNT